MDKQQIEELLKTVNRSAIKAMLRNAAILSDAKATDEMKAQALENVKAIAGNKQPKKSRKVKAPAVAPMQLVQEPAPVAAAPAQPQIQMPEGLHLSPLNTGGHDEAGMRQIFDSLPHEEKQHIVDWHAANQVKKSVETLRDLFKELKKHL